MARMGILGVGTIAEAVVRAMCARPGQSDEFILSPRSEARSKRLAQEFGNCRRADSNQEVIDGSDIVVLAMRPQDLDEALEGLTFRQDQIVASFIAALPPSQVAELTAPAIRTCQVIPLPAIAIHRGPLVISPGIPEVVEVFDGLGDVIVLDDETKIRVLSCASAIMSTYYEAQNRVIDWIIDQGVAPQTASLYIRSELEGLASVGKAVSEDQRAELPAEHQTPGGLNERVRAGLLAAGWFDALVGQVDGIYRNAVLRGPDVD
ncbi:MAG: NAD(P)-binding domain-containing protein [Candidatus Nanopelagicales bacterium]